MLHADSEFVVAGGYGQVGRLLVRLLKPHGRVTIIDPAARTGAESGLTMISADLQSDRADVRAKLATADMVLLALPENAGLAAVPVAAQLMKEGALLADTLSVKAQIVPLLAEWAHKQKLQACSVALMFAPTLEMATRPVATVGIAGGDQVDALLGIMRVAGARLIATSADEHDRLASVLQAATHAAVLAYGRAVAKSGCDVGTLLALAPPPYTTLMSVLARIVSGTPEVYWSIQTGSSDAADMRERLRDGFEELDRWTADGDEHSFTKAIGEIGDYLGPHREELAQRCATLFQRAELRTFESEA